DLERLADSPSGCNHRDPAAHRLSFPRRLEQGPHGGGVEERALGQIDDERRRRARALELLPEGPDVRQIELAGDPDDRASGGQLLDHDLEVVDTCHAVESRRWWRA